jgi:hypothetical protein
MVKIFSFASLPRGVRCVKHKAPGTKSQAPDKIRRMKLEIRKESTKNQITGTK